MAETQGTLGEFSENPELSKEEQELLNKNKTVYSHSRLGTFEQCQLKFKYGYIDKLETEIEGSVEAYLGSRVHETFEKLYTDLKFERENSLQELLDYYNSEWEKHWTENIVIVRKDYDQGNFRKMGERFITEYYNRYRPFRQGRTIGIEVRIVIKLDPDAKYVLQGYIDRLTDAGNGVYEIHDYKTANTLPEQEKLDADRQLALYSIAIKEKYRDCKKVVLIWHYLAFDKELRSERTDQQLEKLRHETINLIKKIESTTEFPPKVSALCDWCEYKPICPQWKHLFKTEKLAPEEFKKEDGVKLVNKYAELKAKEGEVKKEVDAVSDKIILYAEQMNADRVFGSDSKVTIWKKTTVKFPGKNDLGYAELVKELRNSGAWEEFSTLDKWKLENAFVDVDMDHKLMEKIAKYGKKELLKKLYLGKR